MFYKNFAYLCDQLGVTRSNVCKKLGLSENAWKRWENESNPRKSTVLSVSRFFGVSYDEILHVDLQSKPKEPEDESVKARQMAFERSEMRTLFDLAVNAPASQIYEAITLLQKYKEESEGK
jgi:transcriptional regulator with XRE-family HTH domain